MYKSKYTSSHHMTYSKELYHDRQVYDSQRSLNFLLSKSRVTHRLERTLNKHCKITRPWNPFDHLENLALPSVLYCYDGISDSVYSVPSPDYQSMETEMSESMETKMLESMDTKISESMESKMSHSMENNMSEKMEAILSESMENDLSDEEEQQRTVVTYPVVDLNDDAATGQGKCNLKDVSDQWNDSGYGSISDTPRPKVLIYIPLVKTEKTNPPIQNCTVVSDSQDVNPYTSMEYKPLISETQSRDDIHNDDGDPSSATLFTEEDNITSESEYCTSDSEKESRELSPRNMHDQTTFNLKHQHCFFKCDFCDFTTSTKGKMKVHFESTLHTSAAKIIGYKLDGRYYCKSIIDPAAVFLNEEGRTGVNDLAIMCPICFTYYPTMYECANHTKQNHGENVYGIGKVVRQHTINIPTALMCLCNVWLNDKSKYMKHLQTCKHFRIKPQANISFLQVCPFCYEVFNDIIGCRTHIQSGRKRHNVTKYTEVSIIHVRHPTIKIPMLPYACGPTLQGNSETRVIYSHNREGALKAWRRNKRLTRDVF